ncbi:MAG: hypothetical protein C4288_03535 [Leptolyngbya sp. ERB_1_1]
MIKLKQTWLRIARSIFKHRIFALAIVCVLAIDLGITPLNSANVERAVRANDFVETIGVATHFWVTSGGGAEGQYPDAILTKIKRLGVRFYRGYYANSFKNYGLKGIGWLDTRKNGVLDPNGISQSLDRYHGYENELIAIEGPNEYDLTSDPNKWNTLRNYTAEMSRQIRSRPKMKSVLILGPSMASPFNTYKNLVGISPYIDRANIHPYAGELRPESFWDESPPNGRYVDVWFREAKRTNLSRPIWATEVGWNQTGEQVQAKYIPRMFAWFFKQGIAKTMLFQMVDGGDGAKWGLLRQDLSEKLGYQSLKNFIAVLDDRGQVLSPSTLNYRLSGDTTNIETLLLQKSNGKFDLLIWQAKSCWDRDKKVELRNPDRNLVLKLAKRAKSANLYVPLKSASPIQSFSATNSISLSVPDHMLIVELSI